MQWHDTSARLASYWSLYQSSCDLTILPTADDQPTERRTAGRIERVVVKTAAAAADMLTLSLVYRRIAHWCILQNSSSSRLASRVLIHPSRQ